MAKKYVSGTVVPTGDDDSDSETPDTPAEKQPAKPLVERASTIPALDPYTFGYYWEVEPGKPEWHIFAGNPNTFRQVLADGLLNRRMTRLYFSANGIWVEVPLPQLAGPAPSVLNERAPSQARVDAADAAERPRPGNFRFDAADRPASSAAGQDAKAALLASLSRADAADAADRPRDRKALSASLQPADDEEDDTSGKLLGLAKKVMGTIDV